MNDPQPNFPRICVYCGSRTGAEPHFRAAAESLGAWLAETRRELVYGAGRVGLMGVIADAVLNAGGRVTGIIPKHLAVKEVTHADLTTLEVVSSMHERKARMAELADAFIALPGGFGTLEELFEAITWSQLGIHRKPILLLNIDGYFDPIAQMVDHMIDTDFVRDSHRNLFTIVPHLEAVAEHLQSWQPPPLPNWLTKTDL